MKFLGIDPSVKLSSVPIFRFVAIALPIASLICSVVIILNSNLRIDLSFEGFNFWLFTVFRVPFAIIAAWVTVLGVIAAIHRSAQITLQIEKSVEQNTFSNFYKHRQEYGKHFLEIKSSFSEHIKDNISEKIIRGYYNSTYPTNNASNFTVRSRLEWIEPFDEALIELCYMLLKMQHNHNVNIILFLYKEFLIRETSIRQGFFDIATPEQASISLQKSKKILIKYWNGSKSEISICENLITSSFSRVREYADFLTKLKYLADEFEGTMLFGTNVYSGLSLLHHRKELDGEDHPISKLYVSGTKYVELTELEYKEAVNILEDITKSYNRTADQLRAEKELIAK